MQSAAVAAATTAVVAAVTSTAAATAPVPGQLREQHHPPPRSTRVVHEQAQNMAVSNTTSTANEMLPRSLISHDPKPPLESAAEESACSDTGDNQERMMFELNQGEEEEASSFVPASVTGGRVGRPTKWSLGYLGQSAEEECGMIVGGGSFGETNHKAGRSWCVLMFAVVLARL